MKEFRVNHYGNEALSEAIQKKLFELGYEWIFTRKNIMRGHVYEIMGGIDCLANGNMTNDRAGYKNLPEITIDELFQMESAQSETLKIGDRTYSKTDVEAALKNIKSIS